MGWFLTAAIQSKAALKSALKLVTYESGEFKDPDGNQVTPVGSQGTSAGLPYNFSTTTTVADPTTGKLQLNNANPTLATKILVSANELTSVDMGAVIDLIDDGSHILLRANDNLDSSVLVYQVSSIVSHTGWREINVTYVSGNGFTNNEKLVFQYSVAGVPGVGLDGASSYSYTAYATAIDGTGFTTTFNPALKFRATITTTSPLTSPVLSDFTGKWYKAVGDDGIDGADGASSYSYTAYASDASGTDFTLTFNAALEYRAQISTVSPIASPQASDFIGKWYKALGVDGVDGVNGKIPGVPFTWASSTGNADPTTGKFRLSTATLTPGTSATLRISKTDAAGTDRTNEINSWLDGDILTMVSSSLTGTSYMSFYVERQATDVTTYLNVPIRIISGVVPVTNGEAITIQRTPAGSRGGGPNYRYDSSATSGNPGSGKFRTNNSSLALTTALYLDDEAVGALGMTTFISAWVKGGTLAIFPKSNIPSGFGILRIESVTDSGTYYTIVTTPIFGSAITDKTEFVITYIPGPNVQWNGSDLLDSTGVSISDPLTADLKSSMPDPTTKPNQAIIVKSANGQSGGAPYPSYSDGTTWKNLAKASIAKIIGPDQPILILPAATVNAAWTVANSGGFVKLTASGAHSLTTTPAVGASIRVESGTGWTANSFHKISSVVSTTEILLETAFASQGSPNVTKAAGTGTVVEMWNVALPGLETNSIVELDLTVEYNSDAGGTARRVITKLDGNELSNNNQTNTNTYVPIRSGFRNRGSKSSQVGLVGANSNGYASNTSAPAKLTVDTTGSKNLTVSFSMVTHNLTMQIVAGRVYVEE